MLKVVFWPVTADLELCVGETFCDRERQLGLGSRRSAIRFGGGSVFGFKKLSGFFDLPASRSESPHLHFGTGSVGAGFGRQSEAPPEKTLRFLYFAEISVT